jgi:hypothetical protein
MVLLHKIMLLSNEYRQEAEHTSHELLQVLQCSGWLTTAVTYKYTLIMVSNVSILFAIRSIEPMYYSTSINFSCLGWLFLEMGSALTKNGKNLVERRQKLFWDTNHCFLSQLGIIWNGQTPLEVNWSLSSGHDCCEAFVITVLPVASYSLTSELFLNWIDYYLQAMTDHYLQAMTAANHLW